MHIVIDIPEDVYTRLFDNGIQDNEIAVDDVCEMARAIRLGTPLPKGQWIRMSDLSEQEDDRYKCSRCGNVIHHKNKMNLYTFNSWCGRCGSDNGRFKVPTIIEADKAESEE